MRNTHRSPEDVHHFWFADSTDDPDAANGRNAVWFGSSPEFDAQVRAQFEPAIAAAARGDLAAWENAARSPNSRFMLRLRRLRDAQHERLLDSGLRRNDELLCGVTWTPHVPIAYSSLP